MRGRLSHMVVTREQFLALEGGGWKKEYLEQSRLTFYKGSQVSILGFVGQTVYVTTTGLCHCNAKAIVDTAYENENGCVPTELYLQKESVDWL